MEEEDKGRPAGEEEIMVNSGKSTGGDKCARKDGFSVFLILKAVWKKKCASGRQAEFESTFVCSEIQGFFPNTFLVLGRPPGDIPFP